MRWGCFLIFDGGALMPDTNGGEVFVGVDSGRKLERSYMSMHMYGIPRAGVRGFFSQSLETFIDFHQTDSNERFQ